MGGFDNRPLVAGNLVRRSRADVPRHRSYRCHCRQPAITDRPHHLGRDSQGPVARPRHCQRRWTDQRCDEAVNDLESCHVADANRQSCRSNSTADRAKHANTPGSPCERRLATVHGSDQLRNGCHPSLIGCKAHYVMVGGRTRGLEPCRKNHLRKALPGRPGFASKSTSSLILRHRLPVSRRLAKRSSRCLRANLSSGRCANSTGRSDGKK